MKYNPKNDIITAWKLLSCVINNMEKEEEEKKVYSVQFDF